MLEPQLNSEQIINEWITRISDKKSDLGGHSICPFARQPRIVTVDKLTVESIVGFDDRLSVYIESTTSSSYQDIELVCRQLKLLNPNHVFLPDHPDRKNYIKNHETGNRVRPCIIIQTKQELDSARAAISKTDYYSYWDESYLAEIRSFD